jgi:restriction endonuclease S subunit
MLTGEIRNQVDQIWNAFWSGGVSNPLSVIEQITYLLFIKRLDDLHTLEESKAETLGIPMERRVFPEGNDERGRPYADMRWSRFKNFEPREMMTVVADHVFPFLRTLGEEGSSYGTHMKDARLGFDYATSRSEGANLPRISPKTLAEFGILLPPLDEQKRIAAVLDQADELRRLRQRVIDGFNELGQSIFSDMFSASSDDISVGEMLNKGWLLLHKDGNHGSNYPRADDFGTQGVPFLSAKCVDDNGFLLKEENQYLNPKKASTLTIGWIQSGDVLLSHNASVGKVAVYRGEYGPAIIGTSLTCFRSNEKFVSSEFLFAALKSVSFQSQLTKNMSQTTRNQVPITAQRHLKLSIPRLERQKKFEGIVNQLRREIVRSIDSRKLSGQLFESLQEPAFNGQL